MSDVVEEQVSEETTTDTSVNEPAPESAPEDGDQAEPGPDAAPAETQDTPFYQGLPADWRSQAAAASGLEGDDQQALARMLERHSDFGTLMKTFKNAQDMIKRGEVSSGLPENPTEEQLTEWREANGIPAEAGKYEFDLGDGITLSDADKAILEKVAAAGHEHNLSSGAMNAIGREFFKLQDEQVQATEARDTEQKSQGETALKAAWGTDYNRNIGIYEATLAGMPEALRGQLQSMRDGEGRLLGNNTGFVQWAVDVFSKANPTVSVVPPNDTNAVATINGRIQEIRDIMRGPDAQEKYWKKPEVQEEFQRLLKTQQKIKDN